MNIKKHFRIVPAVPQSQFKFPLSLVCPYFYILTFVWKDMPHILCQMDIDDLIFLKYFQPISSTCMDIRHLQASSSPEVALDFIDIVEHSIIGDTSAPILRSFPLISKLKNERLNLAQTTSYRSFENLQFRKLHKNSFQNIRIELRDSVGDYIPFAGTGITRVSLLFREHPPPFVKL